MDKATADGILMEFNKYLSIKQEYWRNITAKLYTSISEADVYELDQAVMTTCNRIDSGELWKAFRQGYGISNEALLMIARRLMDDEAIGQIGKPFSLGDYETLSTELRDLHDNGVLQRYILELAMEEGGVYA